VRFLEAGRDSVYSVRARTSSLLDSRKVRKWGSFLVTFKLFMLIVPSFKVRGLVEVAKGCEQRGGELPKEDVIARMDTKYSAC